MSLIKSMGVPRVKICGITNLEDAMEAVFLGADALGFVFASSQRRIDVFKARDIIQKLPPFVTSVGVFMNQSIEEVRDYARSAGVDAVQLHGTEGSEFPGSLDRYVIKRINIDDNSSPEDIEKFMDSFPAKAFILDPGCGQGNAFSWYRFVGLKCIRPVFIAGGLNPENVRDAVRILKPFGVDVSSGVESSVGKKDPVKMEKFIREAKWISE